jgi:prolipoprotein diacylglyceryltransferase
MFFLTYLMLNGVERFLIEKIRVNTTYSIFNHAITQAEIISFVFIIGSAIGMIYLKRTYKQKSA